MPHIVDDLEYLLGRLDRAFARRLILTRGALQYRLSETGPKRFDSKWLASAFAHLAGRGTLPEPISFLHTAPPPDPSEESGNHAGTEVSPQDLDRALSVMQQLAGTDTEAVVQSLAEIGATMLRQLVGGRSGPLSLEQVPEATALAGPLTLSRIDGVMCHRPDRGAPILLWVAHELPWLGPDDPRLLRRLVEADAEGARLLIVTRKSAAALFPVLKAVGAAAVQLSWFLSTDRDIPTLADAADELGWAPVRDHRATETHGAWGQLAEWTSRMANAPASTLARSREILTVARRHAEDQANAPRLTPASLRRWAAEIGLECPPAWYTMLAAWEAIAAGQLPAAPAPARVEHHDTDSRHQIPRRFGEQPSPDDAGRDEPRPTEVSRARVVAEVDRETWATLKARQARRKGDP